MLEGREWNGAGVGAVSEIFKRLNMSQEQSFQVL